MSRRLPPLNALRAFEASARNLSFARAADELGVTPPAVSHQIKQLEDYLGTVLFRRLTRQVRLTEAGQLLLPKLTEGFDTVAAAVFELRSREESGPLTVSVAPSFAAKWLVPKSERFRSAHPDIDLRISANIAMVDFHRDEVDLAIRFGRGDYPGLKVDELFSDSMTPLCSPRLLDGPNPLRDPADLAHHTLLHDDSINPIGPAPDWRMWLRLADLEHIDFERGPRFSYADHALQAAVDGHGVVLGRLSIAGADLEAGSLVRPFGRELPTEFGYFLVRPVTEPEPPRVAAFRNWILQEVGPERERIANRTAVSR